MAHSGGCGVKLGVMASTYLGMYTHIVFATKRRAPMIGETWREGLHAYLAGTLRGLNAQPYAVGGVADHVHILARLKATHSLADLLRETKKASSIWAHQHYHAFAWQEGYAAFSVSYGHLRTVASYIGNQEMHHQVTGSADELKALLEENGIEFDERFFE